MNKTIVIWDMQTKDQKNPQYERNERVKKFTELGEGRNY